METTTVYAVELCSVGIEWPASTGPITLTFEHLQDAMVAANDDPHIVSPRLKIGHVDPRFEDPADPGHNPYFDGEPALGSVENLRLENEGATLVGDYVDVPVWLAEAMPTSYPSRSIESGYEVFEGATGKPEGSLAVTTPGGKRYSFVLTACALLGLARPAVQDLDDLQAYLTEGAGLVISGAPVEGGVRAGSMDGVPAKLEADVDQVIDAFCAYMRSQDATYWWWPRAMRVDPNVIIADDDEGGLYQFEIITDDDQDVTFGEPERVLQTFRPAPAEAARFSIGSTLEGRVVAKFGTREETPQAGHERPAEGGVTDPGTTGGMNFSDAEQANLRSLLKLSEDATEDDIRTALAAAEGEPEGEPNGGEGGDGEGEPEGDPAGGEGEGGEGDGEPAGDPPASASADSPTISVDKAVWEDMVAKVASLSATAEADAGKAREALLTEAVKAGKIMPSSKPAWASKLAATPEETAKEIAALPSNLIPVELRGSTATAAATGAVSDQEMSIMFPGHGAGKAA